MQAQLPHELVATLAVQQVQQQAAVQAAQQAQLKHDAVVAIAVHNAASARAAQAAMEAVSSQVSVFKQESNAC